MPGEVKSEQSKSFHFFEVILDAAGEAHPGSKRFYDALLDAALLHSNKQRDYGREEDPFANVRAAEEWGIPGWIGCMIRANDKIRRLQTFATKGTLANEGVRDSFMDLAVYALIGLVLFEEQSEKEVSLGCETPACGVALSSSESRIGVSAPSTTPTGLSASLREATSPELEMIKSTSSFWPLGLPAGAASSTSHRDEEGNE